MTRVTRGKVREKISQYWPDIDPRDIMNILNGYGIESHERGHVRVHLAILKLGEGQAIPGMAWGMMHSGLEV